MEPVPTYAALAFGSLFAVLNPLATVPPFLAMTEGNSATERVAMARRACLVACGVLAIFCLTGTTILSFFSVSLGAFRIAGGIVLIRVALEMIQANRASPRITPEERQEGADKDDISITPLGIPVLCGPATITTGILMASRAGDLLHLAMLLAIVVALYLIVFTGLLVTARQSHRLGVTTIQISSRLMGLILVAIAVEFIVQGLRGEGVTAL